ncbi:MAG: hypothetical protein IPI01_02825 [Ignavibacteriae bacterium]|nr:hypothetical protein [Ignavibacteriota bacterium]
MSPALSRAARTWPLFMLLALHACLVFGEGTEGTGITPAGYPDRTGASDILRGFKQPPPGYGDVAFYWWLGDTLTRERLTWQMDQLAGRGVTGLQVNYAHTDTGGFSYGRTMKSAPALFSEEWWDLFHWFLGEARKRGMSVSLSDYTLGRAGQGWYVDEMLRDHPELGGSKLACTEMQVQGGTRCTTVAPHGTIIASAYRVSGDTLVTGSRTDLGGFMKQNRLAWDVPEGMWKILLVHREVVPASLDPMHPLAGKEYIAKFFQRFEDRCPGEAGKGLNFFFSDELDFGIRGWLWNDIVAKEFLKRKGYDILPELPLLFADCGPRTPKIRLDYNDVMVALSEENFFAPIYGWHTERGMLFGCDHGGRGADVTEFGDYFRTQRWMSGPGCDQPDLARDIVKNKVASSIAHLYERPRTWLEGYHSSGWGTSSAQIADATFANFGMGQNLLSLHGLYYSTHGSWWEWAPPDNHFRQPYWKDMPAFLGCVERLSYLLSQGVHRCDVAVLYPVAPMVAGVRGDSAVQSAFRAARDLYAAGIDLDFIDDESVERAQVSRGELHVSGERYRVLVLPAMSAVRMSVMEKAQAFAAAGGTVIALGELPTVSDRRGRYDTGLDAIVREMFVHGSNGSGATRGIPLADPLALVRAVEKAVPRDVSWPGDPAHPVQVLHRSIGKRDVYYVYGATKGTEFRFRMRGKVELWDPWSGATRPLAVLGADQHGTRLLTPLTEYEPQIFVFSAGTPAIEKGSARPQVYSTIPLEGEWQFTLMPTLDNQWGDYRLPAFAGAIGPEASTFLYKEECGQRQAWQLPWTVVDSTWRPVQASFGPQFMQLGPLASDARSIARRYAQLGVMDPADSIEVNGTMRGWSAYEFSWRWGVKGDPGHQGYHGLKGIVHDEQIQLGRPVKPWRGAPGPNYEREAGGDLYYLWSTIRSASPGWGTIRRTGITPTAIWINNEPVDTAVQRVRLFRGVNTLLLRYKGTGVGAFVIDTTGPAQRSVVNVPMSSSWFTRSSVMRFDPQPDARGRAGWYRCAAPPGLRGLRFAAQGAVHLWVDGAAVGVVRDTVPSDRFPWPGIPVWSAELPAAVPRASSVVIRIDHEAGQYGGAAIPEPVEFRCDTGLLAAGDLSKVRELALYSGGMCYSRSVSLTKAQANGKRITLDLGSLVSSARVRVNGESAGMRFAPPWEFDLSGKVRAGQNRIEVEVHTTLGNHFRTVPSPYPGGGSSGLIGPAVIRIGG